MPFGLDVKSMVVGALVAYFVVPWVLGMMSSRKSASASPAV